MKYEIRYKPAFSTLFVTLAPGERLVAESGAMTSMDGQILMDTEFSGSFFSALLKAFLGRESLFVNIFHNPTNDPHQIVLSSSTMGDMAYVKLQGNEICFQPGAFIACTPKVNLDVQWAGFRSWIAGEGLFRLKAKGQGVVFFGTYGGIMEQQVFQELIVDSGHLVAYEPSIQMSIGFASGLLSAITSGEGLVNRLKGQGKVYLQSRTVDGLVRYLRPKIR